MDLIQKLPACLLCRLIDLGVVQITAEYGWNFVWPYQGFYVFLVVFWTLVVGFFAKSLSRPF